MKRTQENFLDWAKDGMAVECNLLGHVVSDAVITLENDGMVYLNQNRFSQGRQSNLSRYSFALFIGYGSIGFNSYGVTQLRPAKPSHKRKPSPESELVGSCTLLKKWKWLTIDSTYGTYLWTHKPEWDTGWKGWDYGKATGKAWACGSLLASIPANGLKPSERLYRRQGDKWVHVG